jgi:hypothetical protein
VRLPASSVARCPPSPAPLAALQRARSPL